MQSLNKYFSTSLVGSNDGGNINWRPEKEVSAVNNNSPYDSGHFCDVDKSLVCLHPHPKNFSEAKFKIMK